MFRDDHDAALARIDALEAELARERADDAAQAHKLAKLEAQLAEARTKLRQTETELDQHRPRQRPVARPKPQAFVAPSEPIAFDKPRSSRTGAILVGGLLIAIVVVGVVLMIQSGSLNR